MPLRRLMTAGGIEKLNSLNMALLDGIVSQKLSRRSFLLFAKCGLPSKVGFRDNHLL